MSSPRLDEVLRKIDASDVSIGNLVHTIVGLGFLAFLFGKLFTWGIA